jgi:hypothetical protein
MRFPCPRSGSRRRSVHDAAPPAFLCVRSQWLHRSPVRVRNPRKPAVSNPRIADKSQIRFRAAVAHDALGKDARDNQRRQRSGEAHRPAPLTVVLLRFESSGSAVAGMCETAHWLLPTAATVGCPFADIREVEAGYTRTHATKRDSSPRHDRCSADPEPCGRSTGDSHHRRRVPGHCRSSSARSDRLRLPDDYELQESLMRFARAVFEPWSEPLMCRRIAWRGRWTRGQRSLRLVRVATRPASDTSATM